MKEIVKTYPSLAAKDTPPHHGDPANTLASYISRVFRVGLHKEVMLDVPLLDDESWLTSAAEQQDLLPKILKVRRDGRVRERERGRG